MFHYLQNGKQVDIEGIEIHQIKYIPFVTAGRVLNTQRPHFIAIINQYENAKAR